jgi:hypothetical protein
MADLSEAEAKQAMESPPKGTFTIIFIIGVLFAAAWLALYFGRFLAHGPVS